MNIGRAASGCSLVLAVLLLAASATAFAQDPPDIERVPAKWQVLSVSRDARTLKLVYASGGCRQGDGRASVHETRSRIRISVDEGEVVGRDVVCPLVLIYRTLRVSLGRAVAGRRIVGGPRIRRFVALYADPGRARELAPAIRRSIERAGGQLERLGRVSNAWVMAPAPALREVVRGCVAGAKP